MQLKQYYFIAILISDFLNSYPQDKVKHSIPDSLLDKLKPGNFISNKELLLLNIIDSGYLVQTQINTYCDTTASLNDSINYSVLKLDNSLNDCSKYYLITINSRHKNIIAYKKLFETCEPEINDDIYETYAYTIISSNHITLTSSTVHRAVHRQNWDEQIGDVVKKRITRHTSLRIKQNGEIIKDHLIIT